MKMSMTWGGRTLLALYSLVGGLVLSLPGCKNYDVDGRPTMRDHVPSHKSASAARLNETPALRAGLSSTAQDIEHSVGR